MPLKYWYPDICQEPFDPARPAAGGQADADRLVDDRLDVTAPDFTDADSAFAAVVDFVADFLRAAGVDPA
jgi:hypothetical protein